MHSSLMTVRRPHWALLLVMGLGCRPAEPPASGSRTPAASEATAVAGASAATVAAATVAAANGGVAPGRADADGSFPASAFPAPSRPVADIVAPRWTAEDARDDAREAADVMRLLGIRAGMTVADIGAGDGYYTVRLAERVGASGLVFAEDIAPEYLALLVPRVEAMANVRVVLGAAHDPRLPRDAVDVAVLVHMYHEIEQPFGLLYHLALSLRDDRSRVAILDLDGPTAQHGTPLPLLRCELEALGYRREAVHTLSRGEYLAVFRGPPKAVGPTAPSDIAARLRAGGCGARR